jgi:hypothetical protein
MSQTTGFVNYFLPAGAARTAEVKKSRFHCGISMFGYYNSRPALCSDVIFPGKAPAALVAPAPLPV